MSFELWQYILLAAAGVICGFVNVLAGGGSLLTIPIMVFMGMDGALANGTNRIAILAGGMSATGGFIKQGFSDLRLSLSLTLCALPGAILGAWFGTRLGGVWFNRVLAMLMIGILVLMALKRRRGASPGPAGRGRVVAAHILMVGVGLYGGFIQAGVGFILIAVLHTVLRLDLVRVNMYKVFIVTVYTVVALAIFAASGKVAWTAGIVLASGNAVGGWVGSHVAVRKGERLIRVVLNVVLVIMAAKLLLG